MLTQLIGRGFCFSVALLAFAFGLLLLAGLPSAVGGDTVVMALLSFGAGSFMAWCGVQPA